MAKQSFTEEDLKSDFKLFLIYVWRLLGLPQPTKVQLLIADFLQEDRGDRIIEAFRGVGKSYITSAFVLWKLWKNRDLKFLIVSASKQRADDFSNFCFILLDLVPQLQHLKPTGDLRASKVAWDVNGCAPAHSPSVTSKGITGQLAGSRADIIIADDIEVPNNSATADQREKLKERIKEFNAIKKADEGQNHTSYSIFLGTPQCEESIYNDMRGFDKRIWTARYPTEDKLSDYYGCVCPHLENEMMTDRSLIGKPTDPKRFGEAELIDREMKYGRSGFALQFQLDTSLSDAERYPLKLADLIIFEAGPDKSPCSISWSNSREQYLRDIPALGFSSDKYYKPNYVDLQWVPYEGAVMAIDPSGRGKDETAYVIVKYLHGYLYLTKAGSIEGGYEPETMKRLALIAKDQMVNQVIVESNFGDGMFSQLLQPILNSVYPCIIEEVRHHTQKELRIIDTLEPVMNSHKLIVSPSVIQEDFTHTKRETKSEGHSALLYSLFYQMTRITKEKGALKHDDRLDALAMAVGYWVDMMSRDVHKAAQEAKDDKLEETVRMIGERADRISVRRGSSEDYFMGLLTQEESTHGSVSNSFLDNI